MLNEFPEVTLYFWTTTIMATTVGETAADFLNFDLYFALNGTSLLMNAPRRTMSSASLTAGHVLRRQRLTVADLIR
ncbi:hypothetical protein [Accumulibacter sp.]|uniref:hypothetical protein n=1 Tax=Accumulibacter sp. TaxID=2053492 RepID=UPI0034493AE2